MSAGIRILLLADSHIGFDLPTRPRVERRRRGHDFLENYAAALRPALEGEVDLVVHAGDVFDRPTVAASIAYQGLEPLRRVADRGVPVFIVPGNHEQSRIPHARLASHPRIHIFDRPRTFQLDICGTRLALAGFPYERHNVRTRFPTLLEECSWTPAMADAHVLCMHHCAEGATVGPADYTFRTASDVIRLHDIPGDFSVALSGHIHRQQALTTDFRRVPIATPVLYPGSIERTSFAEMNEAKGFMLVHLVPGEERVRWHSRPLPARPMLRREVTADGNNPQQLDAQVRAVVDAAPPDAVISIRVGGTLTSEHWSRLSAAHLRTFIPPTMNVTIAPIDGFAQRRAAVNADSLLIS